MSGGAVSIAADDRTPWLAVRIDGISDRDAVIAALFTAGSQGVHEDGAAIVTHFPPGMDRTLISSSISEADAGAIVEMSDAPEADWSEWRASVRAHRLGKVTIVPPWLAEAVEADTIPVVIDPAMAFGTGEHATTRGVVRLMQRLPALPETVADLGAGSAILSICAVLLGANRAVAIEVDPDAIGNAEANVATNGVGNAVHVMLGDAAVILPLIAPVGLVLANIISSVLIELLPSIRDSLLPGGHAILSGILLDEKERMLAALGGDWVVVADVTEDGWWTVLTRRAS